MTVLITAYIGGRVDVAGAFMCRGSEALNENTSSL